MYFVRNGSGRPLLLVHGLGGNHRSWDTILPDLVTQRDVIRVDLPGHGATPALPEMTFAALADALVAFLEDEELTGIDAVGSSMGARLVLELARRGVVGDVVSLDPGGFWEGWERTYFRITLGASIALVRALAPMLPFLTNNPVTRALLFLQFSAQPSKLPPHIALQELRSFLATPAFDELLVDLARGPGQQGTTAIANRVSIGWGRRDYVCFPAQAARALARFPSATLHWFERSGHFPHWDMPLETTQVILRGTGPGEASHDAA